MIGLTGTAMLWAAALGAFAPSTPSAPGLPAAAEASDPPESAAETLAGLQGVYAQSCVDRAYGSFDDICEQMALQIQAYRKKAAKEARAAGRTAPARLLPKPPLPTAPSNRP